MCRIQYLFGSIQIIKFDRLDLDVEFKEIRLIHNRGFVSFVPRPFLLRVFSRAISNMGDFRLAFAYIFLSSFASTEEVEDSLCTSASDVKLRSSKEKTCFCGFLLFCCRYFRHETSHVSPHPFQKRRAFHENRIAHFKHVYLVGEKQELHIASDYAILFLPNRAWHLGLEEK